MWFLVDASIYLAGGILILLKKNWIASMCITGYALVATLLVIVSGGMAKAYGEYRRQAMQGQWNHEMNGTAVMGQMNQVDFGMHKKQKKERTIAVVAIALFIILAIGNVVGINLIEESDSASTERRRRAATVVDNAEVTQTAGSEEDTYKDDDEYMSGDWEGNTYVNQYFGIEFELPSGWQKTDKEGSERMYQGTSDKLENEGDAVIEAIALNKIHASNISFSVVIDKSDDWAETMQKEFVKMKDVARDKVEEVCETYKINPEIDVEVGNLTDIDMGKGQWLTGDIVTSVTPEGAEEATLVMTQRLYMGKRGDRYMLIVLTAMDEDMVQSVEEAFQ